MIIPARIAILFLASLALSVSTQAFADDANPRVIMKTSMGDMTIELFAKEAPISSKNFLTYVESGFFDGTIFHRVMGNFVIQGGGFTKDMKKKKTRAPIKNESANGLKNKKYTLSMARTGDPDSGTSQFFVNLKDNDTLDKEFPQGDGHGYAVFGRVVEGQEVVEKIRRVDTGSVRAGFQRYDDVPRKPVIIEKATIVENAPAK